MKSHSPSESRTICRGCRQFFAVGVAGLAFGLAVSALALDSSKSVFQFNCRTWTKQSGLPVETVEALTQTKDGYLWLGTQSGLLLFDGHDFRPMPVDLPGVKGPGVSRLATASDGTLRFAMNNVGVVGYDGQHFFRANAANEAGPQNVFLARGPFRLGETNLDVTATCADGKGGVWIGTANQGLFLFQGGKITRQSFPASVTVNGITALAAEGKNRLWIGTSTGLRSLVDGKITAATDDYNVSALLVDREQNVWVGTDGGGLLHREGNRFVPFAKPDGLAGDFVTSLCEDAEGNLWVGTREGLTQLSDVKLPLFTSREGIVDGSYHAVAADADGGLWIASATGLSHFNGTSAFNLTTTTLQTSAYFKLCFVARNGDVYAEDGDKTVNVFSGGKLVRRITNSIWISAFDEDDKSVIVGRGTGQALFRIINGEFVPFEHVRGSPNYYWINNLHGARDGAVWVASNNGLFRIENGVLRRWGTDDGLPSITVQCLSEDSDGSMWAGSAAGIVRIKNGGLKSIKIEDGLADGCVYSIVPDDSGSFWFCSSRGIFRADRKNLNDFADGKVARVTCEVFDGPNAIKTYARTDQEYSGCKTTDGKIWFPSPSGVILINPAHLLTNRIVPPVHIDRLFANGKEFPVKPTMVMPPGDGQLEFNFNALSFVGTDEIQFRYKLDGVDHDWIDSVHHRKATYTNLKPGRYQFHVIAANSDGIWNSVGDTVQIELRPPFYQRSEFYFLCGALALVLLGGIYLLRVRHLETKQRALQKIRVELEAEVKRRTAELARSVSVLNAALESTADGLLVMDRQECVVNYNRRFVEMWRVPPEKIGIGKDDQALQWALGMVKEETVFRSKVQQLHQQPDAESFDLIELKDGRIFEQYSIPQRLDDEIVGRVWSFRDVTERKRIERELLESRIFLDRIINCISHPIHVKDRQHRWVMLNDAACNFLGVTRPEILGRTVEETLPKPISESVVSTDVQVFKTGREDVTEDTFTDFHGKQRTIVTRKNLYVDDKGEPFIVGVTQEITERKTAEAELAYERDLMRALMNSTPDAIYFKDLQSRFVRCSAAMAGQFNVARVKDLLGKTDFDFFTAEHARQAFEDEQQIVLTGAPLIGRIEKETWMNGRITWALSSKMPLRNVTGEIIGTLGISKDITPIKDAEAKLNEAHRQLIEVSRQAGMAEVATSVLHNVGNVLNSINVSTTIVADTLKNSKVSVVDRLAALVQQHSDNLVEFLTNDPKGKRVPEFLSNLSAHLLQEQARLIQELEGLQKNVEHIKDIVTMQQSYARISGVTERIKVADLVEDALRINSGALIRHNLEVIRDYASDLPEMTVDRHKVLQILINLIRNAKYACEESGQADKRLTVRVDSGSGRVAISIADNGVGIAPENMTRIFNHGFTTRKNGHGFGLHSGALAAKELGGALTAHSDGLGLGACFTLELPLHPPTDAI